MIMLSSLPIRDFFADDRNYNWWNHHLHVFRRYTCKSINTWFHYTKLRCYPPPTQPSSFSVVEPPSSISLGEDIVFNIKTSKEVEGQGDLIVSAESGTQSINGKATYEGFGSYRCNLTPTDAGKYTVKVCCDGENIDGSPFKVKVGLPPRPDLVKGIRAWTSGWVRWTRGKLHIGDRRGWQWYPNAWSKGSI